MFRSLTAQWDPRSVTSTVKVTPTLLVFRILILVTVLVTVPLFALPSATDDARRIAVFVALGVTALGWVGWLLAGNGGTRAVAALAVIGAAGGTLVGLVPLSTGLAVGCVVTSAAAIQLDPEISLAITAETVAAFLIAGLATGQPAGLLFGLPLTFTGFWAIGLTRHSYLLRAETAEQTLADARRTHEAQTHAAALAERARIAREIHDVLAHSLAAVSVNLQAAEGLLAALPAGRPELAKAIECVGRAGAFTREGLADARRAILALRDDASPAPLSDQLAALAEDYRADDDAVDFSVTGSPRPVPAEAGLAAFRTAQEALTNARKHAPGQPVSLRLGFADGEISVRAVNPLPPRGPGGSGGSPAGPGGAGGSLSGTGAGYGLTGLRERAALGGGTLVAGPAEGEWQVWLTIPA